MKVLEDVYSLLPLRFAREIRTLSESRAHFDLDLSEIRLRAEGLSSLTLGGKNVHLLSKITKEEVSAIVSRLCRGSVYAFRDAIAEGYLPFVGGVRVGLCGSARYEGGKLIGISEISNLSIRIPHAVCDTADVVFSEWERGVKSGMLIFSPPGGGKTTVLRALTLKIASGPLPKRVAVIDERGEFSASDFSRATVDILSGYRRAEGMEIATRTLSPELIVVDEIGGVREAEAMLGAMRGGVPVIASAHASSFEELQNRISLRPFFECGAFDVFVGISHTENGFEARSVRLS